MAPQQMMQCPHGVHVDQCDICTDRRMHYLRRVAGNSRVAGSAWNTISRSTLQRLANTVYPEGHMVHNQNIGNFRNGRTRVLITQNMRNAARNFLRSYGREYPGVRQRIGEKFFNASINAIHDQENNVNNNFHSGNNSESSNYSNQRTQYSNKSGSTRFSVPKKSPVSPGVTSRRKKR